MASYKELLAQQQALIAQIETARASELSDAVARVRAIIEEFGLTEADLFSTGKPRKASSAKGGTVAPKYKDPETGKTWTGRGKAPLWIAGKDKSEFAI